MWPSPDAYFFGPVNAGADAPASRSSMSAIDPGGRFLVQVANAYAPFDQPARRVGLASCGHMVDSDSTVCQGVI